MVGFARWIALVSLALAVFSANAAPITAFYYTSSPESWVGHGETVTVAEGFQFTARTELRQRRVVCDRRLPDQPRLSEDSLLVPRLCRAFSALLTVGFYDHATRFPFQDAENPGLDFSGNGRGNNMLTGFLEVLEAVYAADGSVLKFGSRLHPVR